jgi:high-affinity iron transporter
MSDFLPGAIMGFREGLEAFLIFVVIIRFLEKTKMSHMKKHAYHGVISGIFGSFLIGGGLFYVSSLINRMNETAKLWESGASIIALILVASFIYWMIHNGRNLVDTIETDLTSKLSSFGIFTVTFIMVMREGAEIAIFTFAGKYSPSSIFTGIGLSLVMAWLIYKSLVKVNLKAIFNITLAYLILQAGFLLGYGIHEGLSAFKALGFIDGNHWIFIKAFDLSNTVLYHKEGFIGLPLYVLFGWYSKPEWIQVFAQYGFTAFMFMSWQKAIKKQKSTKSKAA